MHYLIPQEPYAAGVPTNPILRSRDLSKSHSWKLEGIGTVLETSLLPSCFERLQIPSGP